LLKCDLPVTVTCTCHPDAKNRVIHRVYPLQVLTSDARDLIPLSYLAIIPIRLFSLQHQSTRSKESVTPNLQDFLHQQISSKIIDFTMSSPQQDHPADKSPLLPGTDEEEFAEKPLDRTAIDPYGRRSMAFRVKKTGQIITRTGKQSALPSDTLPRLEKER
jgi:hypothetical protein